MEKWTLNVNDDDDDDECSSSIGQNYWGIVKHCGTTIVYHQL
jgi:hypothetical protein